jgi:hypothetical protein
MAPPSDALDAGLAKSNRVALATCRKVDDASRDQFDRRIGAFSEVQFSECSLELVRSSTSLGLKARPSNSRFIGTTSPPLSSQYD